MYCRNCGAEMESNQAICLKCGFKAGDGKKYCSNCGKEVNEGAAVCVSCGCSITKNEAKNNGEAHHIEQKDKTKIALICFFFGLIGIHNFMMGESKKGIFKIISTFFCLPVPAILALIDFIKILMGSYVIDPNKLI